MWIRSGVDWAVAQWYEDRSSFVSGTHPIGNLQHDTVASAAADSSMQFPSLLSKILETRRRASMSQVLNENRPTVLLGHLLEFAIHRAVHDVSVFQPARQVSVPNRS
jgi:hypothetical protein